MSNFASCEESNDRQDYAPRRGLTITFVFRSAEAFHPESEVLPARAAEHFCSAAEKAFEIAPAPAFGSCSGRFLPTALPVSVKCHSSHGFTTEDEISSKCLTLRVASVACEASVIPAIIVSLSSPDRPFFLRAAIRSAACVAATASK